MKTAPKEYILKTVQKTNILPVTSSCTTGCIFCSHKNNPSDIEAYSLPALSLEDIKEMCGFLDGSKKIVIGESASRIIEGEPFLHPQIEAALIHIRERFPKAPLVITTNGVLLTRDRVKLLKSLIPIEINISLNSSSQEGRRLLLKGQWGQEALEAVKYLGEYGVDFNGSIVAMPDVVGYEDIKETISYLCRQGCKTVRVFVPGFSKLSKYNIDFEEIRNRLHQISDILYDEYGVPVLVEPPLVEDLDPLVCGVIKGSAADSAGIKKGDTITSVDGYEPLSRVDAFNTVCRRKAPKVDFIREGKTIKAVLDKKAGESSGLVFYYDIDPDTLYGIEDAAYKYSSKRPLIVTSKLSYNTINLGIQKILKGGLSFTVLAAESTIFGGTICCCGLLTVLDIIESLKNFEGHKADLLILPSSPFDINGRDLLGRYYYEIEEKLGIKTVMGE